MPVAFTCAVAAESPALLKPLKSGARFVVSADAKTVQDTQTTLTWQRSQSPDGVTWKGAYDYCAALRLAGHKGGWRLPFLKELQSLVVEAEKPSLMCIDLEAFPHTRPEFYWTASANDTQVATVFFDMKSFPSGLGPDKTLGNVRCVSGKLRPEYQAPETAKYNLYTVDQLVAH